MLKKLASSVKKVVISSTKVAAVTFITWNYIGGFVICYGPSMEPTLRTRDILLTEQISPRLRRIDIGDVVVARSPADYRSVCKRVVAGPGDMVVFKNKTITVPEDCAWLEGDNKDNSNDSRYYGPVPYSMIRRRCFCRLWPDFDMDLDTPSRYYLDSNPTSRQKKKYIQLMEKENLRQQKQLSREQDQQSTTASASSSLENSRDGTKPSNNRLLDALINDENGELFPMMMKSSDSSAQLPSSSTNDDNNNTRTTPTALSSQEANNIHHLYVTGEDADYVVVPGSIITPEITTELLPYPGIKVGHTLPCCS